MTVLQTGMRNRWRIAVLIYSMTNAVIFGAGLITVLNVSALRVNAYIWIPIVVIASLILAAPIAWLIAPRLQARYDRRHTHAGRGRPFSFRNSCRSHSRIAITTVANLTLLLA